VAEQVQIRAVQHENAHDARFAFQRRIVAGTRAPAGRRRARRGLSRPAAAQGFGSILGNPAAKIIQQMPPTHSSLVSRTSAGVLTPKGSPTESVPRPRPRDRSFPPPSPPPAPPPHGNKQPAETWERHSSECFRLNSYPPSQSPRTQHPVPDPSSAHAPLRVSASQREIIAPNGPPRNSSPSLLPHLRLARRPFKNPCRCRTTALAGPL